MRIVLRVDKGANVGTRYELSLYDYRAVGRAGGVDVTLLLELEGDRPLDPDDVQRVEAHLQNRGKVVKEASDALRFGTYRRGRDILLDDDNVSRMHAMFFFDEEGPSIVDLRSTNGTFVNGKKTSDSDLDEGDIVNIGKTRFVLEIER